MIVYYLLLKICLLYVGYGKYSACEVADNFSGEGCHRVLFPCMGCSQCSPITGGQQPLWKLMLGIKFKISTQHLSEFGQQLSEHGSWLLPVTHA